MKKDDKIFVAGHKGMAGSAILRRLRASGFANIVTRTRAELDLTDQPSVAEFFAAERPAGVVLAAAKVGGIYANEQDCAEFILENLKIETNVIEAAWRAGVERLQFLSSACVFPKLAPQPMPETALLTGPFEPTNEMYAVAKIAGMKLCEALNRQYGFNATSIIPANLYGPGDNFDLRNAHVVPALIRKIHEAKDSGASTVEVWGTGTALREFLHVDDMAAAAVFLLETCNGGQCVNVGSGEEASVRELAMLICDIVGFQGDLVFDSARPDGAPRKVLDSGRLRAMGWAPQISLADGIRDTYQWYIESAQSVRL